MSTQIIGTTFPPASDWSTDEKNLITNIQNQIDSAWSHTKNLLINTTWFGPQFDNNQWNNYLTATHNQKFDCLFLLAAADPVFLNSSQIEEMQHRTGAQLYLLGHFDGVYYFNFHSQVLSKYFVNYTQSQLTMIWPKYVYVNYNRKPRDHRSALVNELIKQDLLKMGIVTLGKADKVFSQTVTPSQHLSLSETVDTAVGNWGMDMSLGIPHDIHSLGRLDIWQHHFLNVVGETEFLPWDNMFISEKTWKPILGLRPFVINGQTKIYQYLRDNGFKTFNHYWSHIDVETVDETQVHQAIVAVIKHLCSLTQDQLSKMYQSMLTDLMHNRERFFQYSAEQQFKINNLFSHAR
jgi:hypothetical protein